MITGRTRGQAHGMHMGPASSEYREATAYVEVGPEDMARLGLGEGETVRVLSSAGQVEVPVRSGKLPSGLLFIPMGPTANALVGTETYGTGMPNFKSQGVELERL